MQLFCTQVNLCSNIQSLFLVVGTSAVFYFFYDILKMGLKNWLSFTVVIYVNDAEAKYKIVHVVMCLSTL